MPREICFVVFDCEEIAEALRQFLTMRREIGSIDRVMVNAIGSAPELAVDLSIMRGTARSKRVVRGPQLAAAMIMYCMKLKIPLPHKTQKFLKPIAGGIALSFGYGTGPAAFDLVLNQEQEPLPV